MRDSQQLEETGDRTLLERATQRLGFRQREWDGRVIDVVGDLPEVVLDATVDPGTTIAFEVADSYREWIVDRDVGYVGVPAPALGAQVWRVAPRSSS